MAVAYLICRATFGNGVKIGMIEAEPSVFCGAVLVASKRMSCVLLAAASTLLVGTAAAAFTVCQDRINSP